MKIVAILGTYRKNKVIDRTVGHILEAAEAAGAQTVRFYLVDEEIHFCDNCRVCCQKEGVQRGVCIRDHNEKHPDSMAKILDAVQEADSIVVASPMNAYYMTAITKRFVERLLPLCYWPWGTWSPKFRNRSRTKKAIVVTSSAMPALLGRLLTSTVRGLRSIARALGAKKIKTLYVGLASNTRDYELPPKIVARAHRLGQWLARS